MLRIGKMEFIAMPGAHDVDVVFIVRLPEKPAVGANTIDDLWNTKPLASRAALMRANLLVGRKLAVVPDQPKFDGPDLDDTNRTILDLVNATNQNFRHRNYPLESWQR